MAGELDAAFFVGPAENSLVQQLAANPDITLAHFRRAAAYEARLPFFNQVKVGEGLLDLASNAPDRDIITLSPVATLVVNDDFNPGLVPLFLEASREVMRGGTLLDTAGTFPAPSRAPSSCTRMPGITTTRACLSCSATCRFASLRWPTATSSC